MHAISSMEANTSNAANPMANVCMHARLPLLWHVHGMLLRMSQLK